MSKHSVSIDGAVIGSRSSKASYDYAVVGLVSVSLEHSRIAAAHDRLRDFVARAEREGYADAEFMLRRQDDVAALVARHRDAANVWSVISWHSSSALAERKASAERSRGKYSSVRVVRAELAA